MGKYGNSGRENTAYKITVAQWDSISYDERATHYHGTDWNPSHSNFHLLEVGRAMGDGLPIPQEVISSMDEWTVNNLRYFYGFTVEED